MCILLEIKISKDSATHVHVATALSLAKRGLILSFFSCSYMYVDKNRTEYSLLANYYMYRRCISTSLTSKCSLITEASPYKSDPRFPPSI